MNFFGKKESKAVVESPEEASKQDNINKVEELVQQPVPQATQTPRVMNPVQKQRVREQLRLAETKLQNTEESLEHLRQQQDWLRRYNELKVALDQENAHLYELNKQQASMSEQMSQLERFETFESIQSDFLRMQYMEQVTAENKRNRSTLDREVEDMLRRWEEQQKVMQQASEALETAQRQIYEQMDNIYQGYRIGGIVETLQAEVKHLDESMADLRLEQSKVLQEIEEKEADMEMTSQEMERHRAGRQSIEMHEQMLEHAEAVLLQLDHFLDLHNELDTLRQRQADSQRRQNEENEQLGRIFTKYQDVESAIQTLKDEAHVHRTSIQGQHSYDLQERAMKLKSRHQMLLSAQSLWNRISMGYAMIEDCTQRLTALRLHLDHSQSSESQLEAEVNRLNRLVHEKEYTYMLSKSQNVIQLRADLKEGVSCSVCGATHHPYHSDTMLEQSKLIADFKTDYELLDAEARSKRLQLEELKQDLVATQARYETEESTLVTLRQRQSEDVKEWRIFSTLDASFHDCSASTNLEGRQALLRQLIENTTRDANLAQQELDNFNFHQTALNEISEKLSVQERLKGELSVRLNEVNTGCQVMAGQVERLQMRMNDVNGAYSDLYDRLDKIITLPDWLREWKRNPESVKMKIQQFLEVWTVVNTHISDEREYLAVGKAELEGLRAQQQQLQQSLASLQERKEKCLSAMAEERNTCGKLLGEKAPKEHFDQLYQALGSARSTQEHEAENIMAMMREKYQLMGKHEAYLKMDEAMSEEYARMRSALDYWIRNFNSQHPAVQYAELERVFHEDRDWTEVRAQVRGVQREQALCQAKVEDLRSRLVALQAEGGRASTREGEDAQAALVELREGLEAKRRESMLQVARLAVSLEEDDKARQAVSSGLLRGGNPTD